MTEPGTRTPRGVESGGRAAPTGVSRRPDAVVGPPPGRAELGRREFLVLGAGALAVLALPAALGGRRRLVRRRAPVMGTIAEVVVPAAPRDERLAQAAISEALDELRAVERAMTRFRPDSDVGRANAASVGARVAVGERTAAVVAAALHWARATQGRFDPCLERAVVLWDVESRQAPPAREEVRRYAGRGLWRFLELEAGPGDVRLHHPDAHLDLGGIAKGEGVDRAVAALRRHGFADALVNVGGDLYAAGRSEDGDAWEVGIRSPSDPRRLAGTVRVSDRAVATSGDYVRFFEHGGRRYHHLLDPETGEPRSGGLRSITVTAPACLVADAAATAAFGLGLQRATNLVSVVDPEAAVVHAT